MGSNSVPSGFSDSLPHQQSALSPQRAKFHIKQALGGAVPPDLDEFEFINEAGHFLASIVAWKWLESGEVRLDLRADITVIGEAISVPQGSQRSVVAVATGTGANPFADYTHLEGDILEITGGGNLNPGFYRVADVVNDYTLTLSDIPLISTGVSGLNLTGTLHAASVALPKDFRELIAVYAAEGTNNSVELTTYQDLLHKRSVNMTSPGTYYAAISHATDANPTITATDTSGTLVGPTPRLEIWPKPGTNQLGALTAFYRAGWATTTSDVFNLKMPAYCESLFLEILRTFVLSRFDKEFDLSEGLGRVLMGPLFHAAIDRDGSVQPSYGPMLGGGAQHSMRLSPFSNLVRVGGPS